MPNTPQKKPTGRPSKEDSQKKQKFGSTIPPELKEAAERYMAENKIDGSQMLEKALTMLLEKEAAEELKSRPLRIARRSVKANNLNTKRD